LHVREETDLEEDVLHKDFSKSSLKPLMNYNISTVTHLNPTIGLTPDEVVEHEIKFSKKSAGVPLEFFGYSNVPILVTDKYTMAVLPYQTEDGQAPLSKVIFLPKDFNKFAQDINPNFVTACLEQLKASTRKVQLFIPQTDVHARKRDLLQLFTNKNVSDAVNFPVSKLVGHKVSSLMQDVYFSEQIQEVVAKDEEKEEGEVAKQAEVAKESASAPEQEQLFIDRGYYYLVLSDNKHVVLQGRVGSLKGIKGKVEPLND
jgi:hypothetical protein